jgi:hypothetical protein
MIHWISYSFLIILSFTMLGLAVRQRSQNIAIMANTIKLLMLQEEEFKQNKTDRERSNEDFLKFVSDSRDWAYQYIEEVQLGLNKFINDLEPEINYFKEYGDIGAMAPNYHSMKKFTEYYEELKKLLPEDPENL